MMVQSIFLELTDGEDGVSGLGKKQQELDRNIDKVRAFSVSPSVFFAVLFFVPFGLLGLLLLCFCGFGFFIELTCFIGAFGVCVDFVSTTKVQQIIYDLALADRRRGGGGSGGSGGGADAQ